MGVTPGGRLDENQADAYSIILVFGDTRLQT
jgi:hypothetical protein